MFQKKISPFVYAITIILTVGITFVVAGSAYRQAFDEEFDKFRLQTSDYSNYSTLVALEGADGANAYNKLAQLISMIETTYARDYDTELLWENVYRSLVVSIGDKYSQYLTTDEYLALIDSSDGNFVGIGVHAVYDVDTNGIYITGVIPNSPAESGGLKKGDVIVQVEDITVSDKNYYDAIDGIRGEEGTKVNFKVLRGEETISFTLTRADVPSENVIYTKLEGDIAYISILSFAETTVSEEFDSKLKKALDEGCKKFIFDVRNNAGGNLDEIRAVLDRILPKGPIIHFKDNTDKTNTYYSDAENYLDGEMVVLCNNNTASAAELFTAALRDYELAEIVGKTTYGKGTMQTTRTLSDGSALKLTTAFYNPPSNVSYDGKGIVPDHDIDLLPQWENRFYKMPLEEDTQLQKAIEILNQ